MYSRQQYGQSLIVWSTLSSIGIHALATLIKHCSSRPCFSLQGIAAHFPSLITVNTTIQCYVDSLGLNYTCTYMVSHEMHDTNLKGYVLLAELGNDT